MKIICIGRNYSEHAKELNNPIPKKPVFFMKPDTALVINNNPFYYPEHSNDVHYEAEIVIKICKKGKHIDEKFAGKYYNEIGIGIDFTARDVQSECKKNGLPWEIAKAFDQSAPVSTFIKKSRFDNLNQINFSLSINGEEKQNGNTRDMIFSIDKIIAYISSIITLKEGDLIFTGTPSGVGSISIGDNFEAFIEGEKLLEFLVK
jgi:2-keto-4-pentenoate hydratase/2-oxohepta-3-ene-1,7-dioic acid hydratase in catechol pathway